MRGRCRSRGNRGGKTVRETEGKEVVTVKTERRKGLKQKREKKAVEGLETEAKDREIEKVETVETERKRG